MVGYVMKQKVKYTIAELVWYKPFSESNLFPEIFEPEWYSIPDIIRLEQEVKDVLRTIRYI